MCCDQGFNACQNTCTLRCHLSSCHLVLNLWLKKSRSSCHLLQPGHHRSHRWCYHVCHTLQPSQVAAMSSSIHIALVLDLHSIHGHACASIIPPINDVEITMHVYTLSAVTILCASSPRQLLWTYMNAISSRQCSHFIRWPRSSVLAQVLTVKFIIIFKLMMCQRRSS